MVIVMKGKITLFYVIIATCHSYTVCVAKYLLYVYVFVYVFLCHTQCVYAWNMPRNYCINTLVYVADLVKRLLLYFEK